MVIKYIFHIFVISLQLFPHFFYNKAMQSVLTIIKEYTQLSEGSWKELKEILSINKYSTGSLFSQLGKVPTKAFFLKEGYAKGYALTEKGNHYNRIIYRSNEFMAALSSLIQGEKANIALECLSDCTLIEVKWARFMELVETNPEIGLFYRKVLEESYIKSELINIELATLTASERYLALRKRCPDIEQHISQLNIASFIGISPVQLSRIRKKLFSS